jgi:hypothetical protein
MPLPPCFDAYLGAAEAALGLWRARRTDPARELDARRAVRALGRFARLFPFASPAAHRLAAEVHALRGRRRAAFAELRRSRSLAEGLGMKLEVVAARRAESELGAG